MIFGLSEGWSRKCASVGRLRRFCESENAHLAALHETTLNLIRRHELLDLLEGLVTRAAELVGATSGYVYLRIPDAPDEMELLVGTGPMAEHRGHRIRRGQGVAGRVWETGDLSRWKTIGRGMAGLLLRSA